MTSHKFEACRRKRCAECPGAYFDDAGEPVKCSCPHHVQAALFGAVQSVQRDMFAEVSNVSNNSRAS
jgi:hypothetical protein